MDALLAIINQQRSRIHGYVRADADLEVGNELIVVPDDALIEGEPAEDENESAATISGETTSSGGWSEGQKNESTRRSIWTRRTETTPPRASTAPVETEREAAMTARRETSTEVPPEANREASMASGSEATGAGAN